MYRNVIVVLGIAWKSCAWRVVDCRCIARRHWVSHVFIGRRVVSACSCERIVPKQFSPVLVSQPKTREAERNLRRAERCHRYSVTCLALATSWQFSQQGENTLTPLGRDALFCMRRFQYALSDRVSSISSISVDALVSRYVLSSISDAQQCESELLIELISIKDRVLRLPSVFLREFHCDTYWTCLHVLALLASFLFFIFLSWHLFSVGLLYYWACLFCRPISVSCKLTIS